MIDTENKDAWCEYGANLETQFITRKFNDVEVKINGLKSSDKYTYDLRIELPADLKSIKTKWIFSQDMFGIPPERAISINEKDFIRYAKHYPNILIILDVEWDGVYSITVVRARHLIREGKAKKHVYEKRKDDIKGNAKCSYIFDLNDLDKLQD